MELNENEITELMNRFPTFELSYETISHKKVSPSYNTCLAIPQGKKYYAWFSFYGDENVCILFDLNRDKKISKAWIHRFEFEKKLAYGTLLYGTILEEEQSNDLQNLQKHFIIEDIFYFEGIPLKKSNFHEKLQFLSKFMKLQIYKKNTVFFSLPVIWNIPEETQDFEPSTNIPDPLATTIAYSIHHIQYRSYLEIKPFLNVFLNKKMNFANAVVKKQPSHKFETIEFIPDYSKPQYRYPTIFQVTADIQYDIYHLFACGKNKTMVYYNVAYIPNYKSSVFMNSLFRKIKENSNLDAIEESDDEEDFQNMTEDKCVDVEKILHMECIFHNKFKKWIPVRVVDNYTRIVHIDKLQKTENETSHHSYSHHPQSQFHHPKSQSQSQSHDKQNFPVNGKRTHHQITNKPFYYDKNHNKKYYKPMNS